MARRADPWEIAELTGRGAGLSRVRAKFVDSHHTSTPYNDRSAPLCLGMLLKGMECFPKEKGACVFRGCLWILSAILFLKSLVCLCGLSVCTNCPFYLSTSLWVISFSLPLSVFFFFFNFSVKVWKPNHNVKQIKITQKIRFIFCGQPTAKILSWVTIMWGR